MDPKPPAPNDPSPPRAFTQGVGLLYQWVGVLLFITMMSICCGSSLLSKDTATHSNLTRVSVHPFGGFYYSAQQAVTLSVTLGVFFGMALAGLGLGLQAQSRKAPVWAILVTGLATIFWIAQMLCFVKFGMRLLAGGSGFMAILFGGCYGFGFGAIRDMRRNPPPAGFEVLPADYNVPYSHLHQDPPEVRLAKELEDRRRKLEIQQAELAALEQKIKRRMKDGGE